MDENISWSPGIRQLPHWGLKLVFKNTPKPFYGL